MRPASIVVCTRDRPELLAGCVASLADALSVEHELVVVEAGDSDAARALAGLSIATRLVRADRAGKSYQLNLGLAAAAHEIVVMTDDDCAVDPGWVQAMVDPFDDPAVGVVFGPVEGLSSVPGAPSRTVPAGPAPFCTWEYAHGAAMAVRRGVTQRVGGYDERLGPGAPLHGEEHDLLLRLLEAGWECVIAAAAPVRHVAWRDEAADRDNLLVYERGAGAFLGAAMRRAPRRWLKLTALRGRHEIQLLRDARAEGVGFSLRLVGAFIVGFARGLMLKPARRSAS